MATIKIDQIHELSADEARTRVAGFEQMLTKFGVTPKWSGNQAKFKGTGVSGSIDVTGKNVGVVVKLGMLAKAAGIDAGRLEAKIRKDLKAALTSE